MVPPCRLPPVARRLSCASSRCRGPEDEPLGLTGLRRRVSEAVRWLRSVERPKPDVLGQDPGTSATCGRSSFSSATTIVAPSCRAAPDAARCGLCDAPDVSPCDLRGVPDDAPLRPVRRSCPSARPSPPRDTRSIPSTRPSGSPARPLICPHLPITGLFPSDRAARRRSRRCRPPESVSAWRS